MKIVRYFTILRKEYKPPCCEKWDVDSLGRIARVFMCIIFMGMTRKEC
jgi:hypothetical protein